MAWSIRSLGTILLDLACPPRCALCGADTDGGDLPTVCVACAAVVAAGPARCLRCGDVMIDGRCPMRRCPSPHWDGLVVLGPYGDDLRRHVLRAKRPGAEAVATALATLLASRHRDTLATWQIDTVVPVPMHWWRRCSRGTSTADQLAVGISRATGLPCRRLVRRVRATPMQNELPWEDRRRNVHDAFRPRRRCAGRRILLVDDVTTTGATLAECRRALVEAGAAAVYAAVVAKADRTAELPPAP